MTTFLYAMLGMLVFDIGARLIWVTTGKYPTITPLTTAWDLAFNAGLAGWVIYLLAKVGGV